MLTHENLDTRMLDIRFFCHRYINDKISEVGNAEILSIKLREQEKYIDYILKRDNFTAIVRLYKRLYKEFK